MQERTRSPETGHKLKKGKPNKITREIPRARPTLTLGNPRVFDLLKRVCEDGTVSDVIFKELLQYGYGRPKETEHHGPVFRPLQILLRHRPGDYDPVAVAKPIGQAATIVPAQLPAPLETDDFVEVDISLPSSKGDHANE